MHLLNYMQTNLTSRPPTNQMRDQNFAEEGGLNQKLNIVGVY